MNSKTFWQGNHDIRIILNEQEQKQNIHGVLNDIPVIIDNSIEDWVIKESI